MENHVKSWHALHLPDDDDDDDDDIKGVLHGQQT